MIRTGFTFRNKHSSEFGIVCDPNSRMLLPEKRRKSVTVPGRDGVYNFTKNKFDVRRERFTCYYLPVADVNTAQMARRIAAWLAEDGELCFDSEPDKFYLAYFDGDISMQQHLRYGEFDLTFSYNPPFALSAPVLLPVKNGANLISYSGTKGAPARLTLTNAGASSITNIQITIRRKG